MNTTFYQNLDFNFIRDIAPVAGIGAVSFVMVVSPLLPAKTAPEFIAYAKANPGKVSFGSSGAGTAPHVFGALFMNMTGVHLVHVPYRGAYMPDLLAGQMQVVFAPVAQSVGLVRTGKLRALAVTAAKRLEVLPDVPSMGEFVPGYEATGWYGIGAPKNTPAEIVDKLNEATNGALADPKLKTRLADLGVRSMPMTPADFGKFIAEETEKWGKVIRAGNIKPE